ncbi:MAG: hypothetical protein OXD36_03815, partial [Rhodobacter sp.]|nr:hypothetical protein [Rhodobacter sp.]
MTGLAFSPHGGPIAARNELSSRFAPRLEDSDTFSRKIVSYQGNRNVPGLRWMKYKEGFSSQLVAGLIQENRPSDVLDPFAGICTAPLVAAGQGINATGIEIMPVGISVGSSIAEAANGLSPVAFDRQSSALLRNVRTARAAKGSAFPHVRITEGAFSEKTERQISAARAFLSHMDDGGLKSLLDLACMSVLEEASYTRKDGQYLRWDRRSNRKLRSSFDVGSISDFGEALERRLREIATDIPALKKSFGKGYPTLLNGSCLEVLRTVPDGAFDMVVTSPPYANRYDYTRTYALELA